MTNCLCFDDFECDIFDSVFLSATLPRLDCAHGDFHVPTEVQNSCLVFLNFYPCVLFELN